MGRHLATVVWRRSAGEAFADGRYSRVHGWSFDGGVSVPASASPQVVRPPMSDPAGIDPEEAFVAALASCHMLSFLWEASRRGFVVDFYEDAAEGVLAKNEAGKWAVTKTTLYPKTRFAPGRTPTAEELHALHHAAHEGCFIAQSVKTEVLCEPTLLDAAAHETGEA